MKNSIVLPVRERSEVFIPFIKYMEEEVTNDYLATLSDEEAENLILDIQIATETIKKVMLSLGKVAKRNKK